MKRNGELILALVLLAWSVSSPAAQGPQCSPLLQHTVKTLQGEPRSLCDYSGRVLLIVNTASFCGYTSQYQGLEKLYKTYGDRGLVVLGFPSNDFGQQEPGNGEQIAKFCRLNYGVTFPMFEKSSVRGRAANPVFASLSIVAGTEPQWNFHKFLVDRGGKRAISFGSATEPTDPAVTAQIEKLLAEHAPH